MQLSAPRTPKHTAADIGLETQSIYYLTSSKTIKTQYAISKAGFDIIWYKIMLAEAAM